MRKKENVFERQDKHKALVSRGSFCYTTLCMLPQQYRLRYKRDFDTLFQYGNMAGGNFVLVKMWKIDPEQYPRRKYTLEDLRIGFVVSLKVSKKAVVRNRLKRQMREVVRLLLQKDRIKKGYIVLFIAKKEMIEKEYEIISQDIHTTLSKAKLLLKEEK